MSVYKVQHGYSQSLGKSKKSKEADMSKKGQMIGGFGASLGGIVIGIAMGWSSPLQHITYTQMNISTSRYSKIAAAFPAGAAVSHITTPILMENLGRKWIIIAMNLLSIFAWILMNMWKNYKSFIVSRFLIGIFNGGQYMMSSVYVDETAHKSIKANICVTYQCWLVVGIMYAYLFSYFPNLNLINWLSAIPHFIIIATMLLVKESPLFLLKKGKNSLAEKSMHFYRGPNYNIGEEMEELNRLVAKYKVPIITMLKEKGVLRAIMMLLGMAVIQQFSGLSTVIYYNHYMFYLTHSTLDFRMASLVSATFQMVFVVIASLVMEKTSRKSLWYVSLGVMALAQFTCGMYFTISPEDVGNRVDMGILPTVIVFVYLCGCSLGSGALPFTMVSDLVPPRIRVVVSGITGFVIWLLAGVTTYLYLDAIRWFHMAPICYFYGTVAMFGIVYVVFGVIETNNRTIEQVQWHLRNGLIRKSNIDSGKHTKNMSSTGRSRSGTSRETHEGTSAQY